MYQTDPENWNMRINWDVQLPALHEFLWGTGER